MQKAERRPVLRSPKATSEGEEGTQNAERKRARVWRPLRSRSAFTLIELMVAVGLAAILLTMIAVMFYQASLAFGAARASIEIHESARAALNALLNDLTAASFTPYDNGVQGYFALSQGPTDPSTGSAPPVWNSADTYVVNNRVIGSDGNEYICTAQNPGQPPANGWQLLGPWPAAPYTGSALPYWSSTATYAVNNRVIYNGNEYICTVANTNQPPPGNANWQLLGGLIDTLTFTTLAPQPGARYAAPEAVEQLALVRYALEWDGGTVTLPGGMPRPTYNLVKRVRFPCTTDPNLNMDQFGWAVMGPNGQPVTPYQYLLPLEYQLHFSPPLPSNDPDVILDATGLRYAQSEVIAFHVLSMNVRLFCLPQKQLTESSEVFLDSGFATGGSSSTLSDTTKNWPIGSFSGGGFVVRIIAGTDAGQWLPIANSGATSNTTLPCTGTWTTPPNTTWTTPPDNTSQYRIEELYLVTGTATGGSANTLTDSTQNWPANSFANSSAFTNFPPPPNSVSGFILRIIGGTGAGQALPIASASGSTVTCSGAWNPVPDSTSQYRIEGLLSGTASAASTATTLVDGSTPPANWPIGSFSGGWFTVQIVGGTGAGQALPITSATSSNTLACAGTWNPIPDNTSQYQIIEPLSWNLGWYQRGGDDLNFLGPPPPPPPLYPCNYNFFGTTYRPPAVVEVTLEMTNARATRSFFFTQRFYVPASER
jgi:prepilin-type N-terminal cleavage/methylation domain-containing protein